MNTILRMFGLVIVLAGLSFVGHEAAPLLRTPTEVTPSTDGAEFREQDYPQLGPEIEWIVANSPSILEYDATPGSDL